MIKIKALSQFEWILVVAVAVLALNQFGYINLFPVIGGAPVATVAPTATQLAAPGTSQGCAVNPSVVLTATDVLQPGTAVTATGAYRLNGVYTGSTSPTTLGTADVILTASGYMNTSKLGFPVNCGSNQVAVQMYSVATPTMSIYSNNGLNILGNSATGVAVNNETVASTGGSYNWRIHMIGTDKKSTGTQLLIVEFTAPTANISTVSLSSGTVATVPGGYTRVATNGAVYAWAIPAITGNTIVDYNLAVTAATGYYVTSSVYATLYGLQPFVETDGSFNSGTAAFDSLNSPKNSTYQQYAFLIK